MNFEINNNNIFLIDFLSKHQQTDDINYLVQNFGNNSINILANLKWGENNSATVPTLVSTPLVGST